MRKDTFKFCRDIQTIRETVNWVIAYQISISPNCLYPIPIMPDSEFAELEACDKEVLFVDKSYAYKINR